MAVCIGIDFDNTIAGYDQVFQAAAAGRGWLPAGFDGDKRAIRDTLRRMPDGERRWMALQGEVYGPRMGQARMLDGVDRFLRHCRDIGQRVAVVSHKTERGHFDPTETDLRQAALTWMEAQGFFAAAGFGLNHADIHFESNREAKILRIVDLACDVFIDDLEEVLCDPAFPPACRRLHLAGDGAEALPGLVRCRGWAEVFDAVFG